MDMENLAITDCQNQQTQGTEEPVCDGPPTCVATPEMLRLMDSVFLEDALQDGLTKYTTGQKYSNDAFLHKLNQLNEFFVKTDAFIAILKGLKVVIQLHNGIVLAAKTSGTAATTVGTVVGVTGLALAPFTLSSSLTVSVGAAASVGGAATSLITSWWDAFAKSKIITVIQLLAGEHRTYRDDLTNTINMIGDLVHSIMEMGLTADQALYAVLHEEFIVTTNDENKSIDHVLGTGMIKKNESWMPLTKFCFSTGFHAFRVAEKVEEVAEVVIACGREVVDMFRFGSRAAAQGSSSSVISQGSKLIGSAVVRNALAIFGVAFTTMDIVLLVQDWKTKDPTIEGIEMVIRRLEEDIDSTNIRKLWINVQALQQCDMIVGWIGDIPVVGTSPFAVEGLLCFYAGDFQKLRKLYGVAHYRVVDTVSIRKLNVGFTCTDHLRKSIRNYRADNKERTTDKPLEETSPKPVNGKTFLDKLPEHEIIFGVPIFNPDVLRLNRDIIDSILLKASHPSVEELRDYLDMDFLAEYDNPLPSETVFSVKDVLICSYKYGGHINANNWEYNMTLELLKECASSYFNRQSKLGREMMLKDGNSDDLDQKQFGGLTKCLVRHKSFTDCLAVTIWERDHGENEIEMKKYKAIFDALAEFIVLMEIKLPYWTYEISLGLDKFKYHNPDQKVKK